MQAIKSARFSPPLPVKLLFQDEARFGRIQILDDVEHLPDYDLMLIIKLSENLSMLLLLYLLRKAN